MKKVLALSSLVAPAFIFAETAAPAVDASLYGPFAFGFAVFMSALAIGVIGYSAAQSIGRNPSAANDIKSAILLPMVLAEGLGIIAVVLAFVK
jgi:F-type H+-transporting ATPase subunit c